MCILMVCAEKWQNVNFDLYVYTRVWFWIDEMYIFSNLSALKNGFKITSGENKPMFYTTLRYLFKKVFKPHVDDIAKYVEATQQDQKNIILATDTIAKAVHAIPAPFKAFGINIFEHIPFIKKQMAMYSMGLGV